MVWAGISSNGRTALVIVNGNVTSRRYIDESHRPHVVPYLRQMGQNAIFQDDNARTHRARIVDDFLRQNGVEGLGWPPMSPDLSCIEHLWDILGRAVNKRINQQTRLADLQRLLLQEWAVIPQIKIQRLGEFNEEEAERVSGVSWWIYPLLSDRYCDFVIFDTQPRTAVFNTSQGTWRMLMYEKPCLIPLITHTTSTLFHYSLHCEI